MKSLSCILLFLCIGGFAFSQQENYNKQWVQGLPITFKTTFTGAGPVNQLWDSVNVQSFSNGHSNICTGAGELLLATDGGDIYDANRQIIDNGDTICSAYAYSSIDGFAMQTTTILPLGDSIYYVFNTTWSDSEAYKQFYVGQETLPGQVLYNVVDMKQNNFAGKVIKKKQVAVEGVRLASSNMTAVRHGNGSDWWLIKQGGVLSGNASKTYTFLVKRDTVLGPYTQTYPNTANGIMFGAWSGQSTVSNSGTKYVAVDYMRYMFMADFDRCTGLFSNVTRLYVPMNATDSCPDGACFSPNDSFIYVSHFASIYQYELYNPDSATAWVKIADRDTNNSWFAQYVTMFMGPDQKIYIGNASNVSSAMSVINNPNAKGPLCDFCPKCLRFPTVNGLHYGVTQPPNMPNYVLGIDPKCPPEPNSVAGVKHSKAIRLYPNPASSSVTIEYPAIGGSFELVDMTGRVRLSAELKPGSGKMTLSTAELPVGVYVYRCVFKDGMRVGGRLIIGR